MSTTLPVPGSGERVATVLVIDDDPGNLAIVSEYLRECDYTILIAEDGTSGINRAVYARPDLILLDVLMPGMDGYETCRRLKREPAAKDIPVIFMTALTDMEHKVRAFETGAVDYITKPFQRGEVLARVGVHLHIRELALRLREANELLEKRVEARTAELRDSVTEHRKLEEQLRQAQKMEAVGTLAGGVAHDFNNILTAIIGFGTMLKLSAGDEQAVAGFADDILAASERAANLTRSLLAFSRKQLISTRPEHVNEIVNRIEKFLIRVIGEDIEFGTRLSDEDLVVLADSGQVEQVLMNLAANARDAMPSGGLLTIATERVEVGAGDVNLAPGGYAVISVSDTGAGMDAATRQRIFEPFFTTKEVGKGTGLGLSIVYGILKQHNGEITVYSEPGQGTSFRIYLKLVDWEAESGPEAKLPEPTGGTETILLAEDDAGVRKLMTQLLQAYGYTVIEAVDGEDAVARFGACRDVVDLIVMDLVMPRKSGQTAYREMQALAAGVPVLFTSGYSAEFMRGKGALDEGAAFISKPVTPHLLLSKVREVMSR